MGPRDEAEMGCGSGSVVFMGGPFKPGFGLSGDFPIKPIYTGTCSCGMGRPAKRCRHGFASRRTHFPERETRALSVAMPVSAYIWR